MLQLVDINAMLPGMYIVKVTKPAGKIKIAKAGRIRSSRDIAQFAQRGVLEVQVDLSKSSHQQQPTEPTPQTDDQAKPPAENYNQHLNESLALQGQAKSIQGRLIKRVAKGKITNLEEIEQLTEQVVTSAFERDDTLFISTMLKDTSEYHLEHSINCAILIVLFGRALNLDKETIRHLGIGAVLMDIGMTKMPLLLTHKADALTEQEIQRMRRHVEMGLKLTEPLEDINKISKLVIKQHHERMDGSGYPDGLKAEQISQYGKMAAIVDTYDSLTSVRPYREALKPDQALKKMAEEPLGLDKELVKAFISCIGAHPVGSLVKLASGKLAMVMRLNKNQPLSPVVMVFYNLTTKEEEIGQIDLAKIDDKIVGTVTPADFGIELSSFLTQSFFKAH